MKVMLQSQHAKPKLCVLKTALKISFTWKIYTVTLKITRDRIEMEATEVLTSGMAVRITCTIQTVCFWDADCMKLNWRKSTVPKIWIFKTAISSPPQKMNFLKSKQQATLYHYPVKTQTYMFLPTLSTILITLFFFKRSLWSHTPFECFWNLLIPLRCQGQTKLKSFGLIGLWMKLTIQ